MTYAKSYPEALQRAREAVELDRRRRPRRGGVPKGRPCGVFLVKGGPHPFGVEFLSDAVDPPGALRLLDEVEDGYDMVAE